MTYPMPISRTLSTFVTDGWIATADREWTLTLDGEDAAVVREAKSGRFMFAAGDDVEGGHGSIAAAMLAAENALGV